MGALQIHDRARALADQFQHNGAAVKGLGEFRIQLDGPGIILDRPIVIAKGAVGAAAVVVNLGAMAVSVVGSCGSAV